jgi:hypothetical protein
MTSHLSLHQEDGWTFEYEEDLILTPTPRPEQVFLPFLEDIRNFRFPNDHRHLHGYHRYQVVTTTIDQGKGKVCTEVHDWNLDDGLLRWRSFKKGVPDHRVADKNLHPAGKAFYQGIPRGYKGAVKENIRFMRCLFPDHFGCGVEHRTGKNRGVNMKLVNKCLK